MGLFLALASLLMTTQSDPTTRDAQIAKAIAAARAAMPIAEADPNRPAYHYRAPANWMNDPNGPIFDHGWYHLFYQFNPFGDHDGDKYWGHIRSRDLVNWEELPIAIWPSYEKGETGNWSGSSFRNALGEPVIVYTSWGRRPSQQWAAMPDDPDLIKWHKSPQNPIIEEGVHGMPAIQEWRDPFLFKEAGKTYLITGGGQDGHGEVFVYRSTNDDLTAWSYVGVLFHHPDPDVRNIECPNFAKIGDHWVLLTSVHGRVEAFVGRLDDKTMTLQVEKRSVLEPGSYASQLLPGPHGRLIHFAWIPMDKNKGWNGCLTMPSILTLAADGTLLNRPVPEFKKLREKTIRVPAQNLDGDLDLSLLGSEDLLEIEAEISPGSAKAVGIKVRGAVIRYDAATRTLTMPGRGPETLPPSDSLKLHIFLDKSILEVYAADGAVSECCQFDPGDPGLHVFSEGGSVKISRLTIYPLKPALFDTSRFKTGE